MKSDRPQRRRGIVGALALIVVGLILLMEKNGVISSELVSRWWPLLLVVAGGWLLGSRLGRRKDEG